MKLHQMKARVKWDWSHPNCAFNPRDRVRVCIGRYYDPEERRPCRAPYSGEYLSHYGEEGTVVAVSCTESGNIRSATRQFTRYYVLFDNGDVVGYHSHHIAAVKPKRVKPSFEQYIRRLREDDNYGFFGCQAVEVLEYLMREYTHKEKGEFYNFNATNVLEKAYEIWATPRLNEIWGGVAEPGE